MSKKLSVERIALDMIRQYPKHLFSFEEIKKGCPFVSDGRLRKALSILRKDGWISVKRSETNRRKKAYTLKVSKDRAKAWVNGEYPFDDTKLTHLGGEEGVLGIFHNLGATIPIINSPQVDRIPYDPEKEYITSGTTVRKAVITLPFVKENRNHRATLRNFNNKAFTVNFRPFSYRGADRTHEMWNKIVDYVEDLCNFLESEYGYVVGHPKRRRWEIAVENRYLDDIVRRGWYLIGDDHWVDNTPRTKDNHAKEETHDPELAQGIGDRIEKQGWLAGMAGDLDRTLNAQNERLDKLEVAVHRGFLTLDNNGQHQIGVMGQMVDVLKAMERRLGHRIERMKHASAPSLQASESTTDGSKPWDGEKEIEKWVGDDELALTMIGMVERSGSDRI